MAYPLIVCGPDVDAHSIMNDIPVTLLFLTPAKGPLVDIDDQNHPAKTAENSKMVIVPDLDMRFTSIRQSFVRQRSWTPLQSCTVDCLKRGM